MMRIIIYNNLIYIKQLLLKPTLLNTSTRYKSGGALPTILLEVKIFCKKPLGEETHKEKKLTTYLPFLLRLSAITAPPHYALDEPRGLDRSGT